MNSQEVLAPLKAGNERFVSDKLDGSTIIGDAVAAGKLQVVPAYYELGSGRVEFLTDLRET